MCHAPASTAAVELNFSVAPAVDFGRVRFAKQAYLVWPVVGPQGPVPSADGAMALVEVCWCSVDFDVDCTAVARGGQHGEVSGLLESTALSPSARTERAV